jgi:type III secretory pathway component EscS
MIDLVVSGLVGFLVIYLLSEKTKTTEKSKKQRFSVKFVVIYLAYMLVAAWLLGHIYI